VSRVDPAPEENVEAVRRTLETFATDEDAWLATLDPGFEWCPIEEGNIPSHGLDSARRIRDGWFESFEGHGMEIDELTGDGENVVSSVHLTARGRESGVAVDIRIHMQWKVRDGKAYYMYEHGERDAALQAAGLSG
jgi:ketosteroid isomerase-like protein